MKLFSLPDDIVKSKSQLESSILIYHYSSSANKLKEKSVLNRNAISLVIKGEKTMNFAEKTVFTNDKEIHLLSAGNCIASTNTGKTKHFESILIFFDNKELIDFFIANADFIDRIRKNKPSETSGYISIKKDSYITNYIHSLKIAIGKELDLSDKMKKIKLNEILLHLLEHHSSDFLQFKPPGSVSQLELKIRTVAEANILSNLSIQDMAFLCNLSVATFKRQFQKIFHAAPGAWMLERKINMAANMLKENKERPGEIWFKLGFATHTGFTKSFKKQFGCSPSHYAKI